MSSLAAAILTHELGNSVRESFDQRSRAQNGTVELDELGLVLGVDLTRSSSTFGQLGRRDFSCKAMLEKRSAHEGRPI